MKRLNRGTIKSLSGWLWLLPLVFCNCGVSGIGSHSVSLNNTSDQPGLLKSQPSDNPNSPDAPEWRKEAWQRFTAEGKYRLANASDFSFSEAAKKKLQYSFGNDWYTKIAQPYIGGDINHDNASWDLAVIVVDVTHSEVPQFGLVVFNAPKDRGSIPTLHWLYRNRDLSKVVLTWWSGGLIIEEYREDGSSEACYVNWNEKRQAYSCDTEYTNANQ